MSTTIGSQDAVETGVSDVPESITCDVAIVGYGPVGMVLSSLLAQRGLDVVVLERHHDLYPLARAGHYDGETMRTFQEIGVAEAVELVAQSMLQWNLVTGDKEVLTDFHLGEGGAGWKESYLSYQPEVERIFDPRARALGVRVLGGMNVEGVDQGADRARVTCRPVDGGEDASPTVIEAAYVIGADGANSFVRSALGIDRTRLGFAPMDNLVIDFRLDDPDREFDTLPEVYQVLDPERPILAGRWEGRNHTRLEFTLHEGEDAEEIASEASCWKLLEPWGLTPADGKIARAVVYRFEATLAPVWRDGRVLLSGDAAHTMPPTMGQGLCSGISDAINMAWKLEAVIAGHAGEELLDTVQSERSAHVRALIQMCVGMGEMWNTRDADKVEQRNQMLRMGNVPPAPPLPRLGTGIVVPEASERPIVNGRPSPQARVARDGRVDRLDQFGSGWKVVSRHPVPLGLLTEEQRKVVDELGIELAHVSRGPGPDYYVDIDGDYELWFRKHGLRAFIQRPDKYIFGAVAQIEDVPALLDQLARSLDGAGWRFTTLELTADESADAGSGSTATTPYPGPVDLRHVGEDTAALFTSFFSAKTKRLIDETHEHFHPDRTYYADATLGWKWSSNQEMYGVWKQYMPFWGEKAKSYPVQVLGDTRGAAVMMVDTPELFGGEIRGIAIVDLVDEKIVRWVDYWDGREFGSDAAAQMKVAPEGYPEGLGIDTVADLPPSGLGPVVERL